MARTTPTALPSLARIAVRIVEDVPRQRLLYVVENDTRAARLAAMVAALAPGRPVVFVAASDALPGDAATASPANIGARNAALRMLRRHREASDAVVCIVGAETTARTFGAPEEYDYPLDVFTLAQEVDVAGLEARFTEHGYIIDDRVDEPGEVAVRGQVLDIFPVDRDTPVRCEIADDIIASIRSYDPLTQRTADNLTELVVERAREPASAQRVSLLAHAAPDAIVFEPGAAERRDTFVRLAADVGGSGGTRDMLDDAIWQEQLSRVAPLEWADDAATPVPRFVEQRSPTAALKKLVAPVLAAGGRLVLVGSERDLRFLRPRLARSLNCTVGELPDWQSVHVAAPGSINTLMMPADAGFQDGGIVVVAAADLLGSKAGTGTPIASNVIDLLGGIGTIRGGDVVVHEDHGLAVVRGLEPGQGGLDTDEDAIVLEFADGARRLVPVSAAERLWRYGAEADAVTLDKLDGSSWAKRRAQTDEAIAETARELVALAKVRAGRRVDAILPDAARYERFAAGFPFSETPDQARAIADVRDDLASGQPMQRLIIGDVGYGKTEVALRAAAMVALAGKQVALAAPTTVLVRQHLDVFERRFAGTGITVAALSRLSTPAEAKRVKAGLADGSIQVVVGTSALAGKAVRYHALGLVIVDEEQRFGAADKVKLQQLHDGHYLAMSATPIPGTLQTALVGLQQLSIIATPPSRRQPIRTLVASWDDTVVKAALLRERARGGQSFVVVPRIDDLVPLSERLQRLVPQFDLIEAHGKLPAPALDEAMAAFAKGHGDILLATNIIEAGLDVPRANTMIVWHADRFGLAQLHQLRGRVGRGSRRGHILLLTEGNQDMVPATMKRLNTLAAFDRLGAGFAISARDLDLRGGGDLLGENQTGHMKLVGIDLYQHLLDRALRTARGEVVDDARPELRLEVGGQLPAAWIADVDVRLELCVRLARCTQDTEIDQFEEEVEDRFGTIPPEAGRLLKVARVRALAKALELVRIDAGPAAIALTPCRPLKGGTPHGLVEADGRYLLRERIDDHDLRLDRLADVLGNLAEAL